MKLLLSAAVTFCVIVVLLIKPLRVHKWKIMGVYAVSVIGLFAFYNYRTMDLILPFYRPTNQMFYQSDFLNDKSGEALYPDAFLSTFLDGKDVYIPSYINWEEMDMESEDVWESGKMLCLNIKNILTAAGANIIPEDDYEIVDAGYRADEMTDMGCLNDTFRYSFLYNDIDGEYGNAFYYYWFYGASSKPFKLFIGGENVKDADELELIFDWEGNIYLVPKV